MEVLGRSIIAGCLVLLCLVSGPKISAQETTVSVLDLDDYSKILDKLFPRDVLDEAGRTFMLVLRYKPSFNAESQIVIAGREGRVNVVELTSLDGNIYYKLTEVMQQTGQESSVELAKYIRIKKRELKIPLQRLDFWRRKLLESLSKALNPKVLESILPSATELTVTEDGTGYELWDSSISGEVYFSPSGIEEGRRDFSGKRSLIKLMERIKQEVSKRS